MELFDGLCLCGFVLVVIEYVEVVGFDWNIEVCGECGVGFGVGYVVLEL